jgi:hypothetical protein
MARGDCGVVHGVSGYTWSASSVPGSAPESNACFDAR